MLKLVSLLATTFLPEKTYSYAKDMVVQRDEIRGIVYRIIVNFALGIVFQFLFSSLPATTNSPLSYQQRYYGGLLLIAAMLWMVVNICFLLAGLLVGAKIVLSKKTNS